jgi:hypothetical protein
MALVSIMLLSLLFYAAVEDFRHLGIRWVVFPSLFIISLAVCVLSLDSIYMAIKYITINVSIVFFQYLGVVFYVFIKDGDANVINKKIGLGDFLFLIAISPLFHPVFFVIFLIAALILTLWTVLFLRGVNKPIPLAGYLSLMLILAYTVCGYFSFSFYTINTLF